MTLGKNTTKLPGDQFIEQHGFSGSLPLFCYYASIVFVHCGK